MMKANEPVKQLEHQAAQALCLLLEQVPAITLLDVKHEAPSPHHDVDVVANIEVFGRPHTLACEVNSTGQPRHVRTALLQLRNYVAHHEQAAIPVFIAPYLSSEAQALCRAGDVGFLDLEGNVRLVFDSVFIERQVASKPAAERRELRSMFKPKAAQVLRVLFRDPSRAWRVTEIAQTAGVSLGHVSNVRAGLLDREWAKVSEDGLFLSAPHALLDEWREAYEPPPAERMAFYTTLHGNAFEDAARQVLRANGESGLAAFSSFSAAQWLAPYGRTGTQYLYADDVGLERLRSTLKLSATSKGENVVVSVLKDSGLFRDAVEPAPGAICTSLVQTYLDLGATGERGREAADHLRRERLQWPK